MNLRYCLRQLVMAASLALSIVITFQLFTRRRAGETHSGDRAVGPADEDEEPLLPADEPSELLARRETEQSGAERLQYCAAVAGDRICGKAFDSKWVPYLVDLGLSDAQTAALNKSHDRKLFRRTHLPFFTAFSDNHANYAMEQLIKPFADRFKGEALTVVDLGLSEQNKRKLTNFEGLTISVEDFPFHQYPAYVRKLTQYRWKPLLIAELMKKHGGVFYMDAHIEWVTNDLGPLVHHLACNRRRPNRCGAYPLTLLWPTGHSIKATTNPLLYQYFPIEEAGAAATEMACAGYQYVFPTSDVLRNVYKWAVLCALEEECMAPKGMNEIACNLPSGKARYQKYAGCHRYDQSVFNILLANRHAFDRSAYYFQFNVPRKNLPRPGEYRPPPFKPLPLRE